MNKKKLALEINSLGRFSMSNWSKNNIKVGETRDNKIGNPNWIKVKKFGEENIKKYLRGIPIARRKKMSLHDVGCNDGYLTEQLACLNFKKIIGTEPRSTTISRGKKIRKILGIKEKANYFCKSIKRIDKKLFSDVVVCSGVIHHTDNILENFKKLLHITKKILVVEGEFIEEKLLINKTNEKFFQVKDFIYDHMETNKIDVGFSINKYESEYFDGSSIQTGLVETPSISKLLMIAKLNNFQSQVYRKKKFKNSLNTYRAIVIFKKKNLQKELSSIFLDQELIFLNNIIPFKILKKFEIKRSINLKNMNHSQKKIISNFRYNKTDKINFELAKYFIKKKKIREAKDFLNKIIYKFNADWFSCYRAFALYSLIDKKNKKKWLSKLKSSNPNFPIRTLKYINL